MSDLEWVRRDGVGRWEAEGGGGGSVVVRGPYSFDHTQLIGMENGIAFYTPTVGDFLLDAWFEVDSVFNSAAQADVSQYTGGSSSGLFGYNDFPVDLTFSADSAAIGGGPLQRHGQSAQSLILHGVGATSRLVPARFATADPLLLVVSENGDKGGSTSIATLGAARLYVITATPVAFA